MVSNNEKRTIFSLLDLTSLQNSDNAASIAALCQKAQGSLGSVAAVCIYPQFVADAVSRLANSSINIATVANFPHGDDKIGDILTSITQSLSNGATEIDVVFPYKHYLQGYKLKALEVISLCKKTMGTNITLKVILETGIIDNLSTIEQISHELIGVGANFLKTSTGKVSVGATIEAAAVMLSAIKESGANVGFKASGGIRTIEQAMSYIRLAEDILGKEWISPYHMRIGTSGISELSE